MRKAAHASKEQLWLAHRYSISVPRGYTFVRPHARGGLDAKKKTIYRSRSAASLIYNITENSAAGEAEWFKFERDVARYMKAKGFTVQHQSVSASDCFDFRGWHEFGREWKAREKLPIIAKKLISKHKNLNAAMNV